MSSISSRRDVGSSTASSRIRMLQDQLDTALSSRIQHVRSNVLQKPQSSQADAMQGSADSGPPMVGTRLDIRA